MEVVDETEALQRFFEGKGCPATGPVLSHRGGGPWPPTEAKGKVRRPPRPASERHRVPPCPRRTQAWWARVLRCAALTSGVLSRRSRHSRGACWRRTLSLPPPRRGLRYGPHRSSERARALAYGSRTSPRGQTPGRRLCSPRDRLPLYLSPEPWLLGAAGWKQACRCELRWGSHSSLV